MRRGYSAIGKNVKEMYVPLSDVLETRFGLNKQQTFELLSGIETHGNMRLFIDERVQLIALMDAAEKVLNFDVSTSIEMFHIALAMFGKHIGDIIKLKRIMSERKMIEPIVDGFFPHGELQTVTDGGVTLARRIVMYSDIQRPVQGILRDLNLLFRLYDDANTTEKSKGNPLMDRFWMEVKTRGYIGLAREYVKKTGSISIDPEFFNLAQIRPICQEIGLSKEKLDNILHPNPRKETLGECLKVGENYFQQLEAIRENKMDMPEAEKYIFEFISILQMLDAPFNKLYGKRCEVGIGTGMYIRIHPMEKNEIVKSERLGLEADQYVSQES